MKAAQLRLTLLARVARVLTISYASLLTVRRLLQAVHQRITLWRLVPGFAGEWPLFHFGFERRCQIAGSSGEFGAQR